MQEAQRRQQEEQQRRQQQEEIKQKQGQEEQRRQQEEEQQQEQDADRLKQQPSQHDQQQNEPEIRQRVYDLQASWASEAPGLQSLHGARGHKDGGVDVLFVIRRSSNKNIVVYSGRPSSGVDVKWIMFDKAGAPTEELTYMEKNTAYGTSVKKVRPTPLVGGETVIEQYEVSVGIVSSLVERS